MSPPITLEVLAERLDNFMHEVRTAHKELRLGQDAQLERMSALEARERERNGQLRHVGEACEAISQRQNKHDEWHGREDRNIGKRLEKLEQDGAMVEVRADAKRELLQHEWKLVAGGTAFGGGLVTLAYTLGRIFTIW